MPSHDVNQGVLVQVLFCNQPVYTHPTYWAVTKQNAQQDLKDEGVQEHLRNHRVLGKDHEHSGQEGHKRGCMFESKGSLLDWMK